DSWPVWATVCEFKEGWAARRREVTRADIALDTQRVGHSTRDHPGWFAAALMQHLRPPGRRSTPGTRRYRGASRLLLLRGAADWVDYTDGASLYTSCDYYLVVWDCISPPPRPCASPLYLPAPVSICKTVPATEHAAHRTTTRARAIPDSRLDGNG